VECVLKDLIAVSKDGEWGQGEPFDDSVEMLAIRGTDFEDVRFGDTTAIPRRHIAKRHADRKLLQPWDVIFEAAGGTKNQITGRTVLLRPQVFTRSCLPLTCASFSRFIRFNRELCDPEFMFWYLQYLYDSGLMHAYHTQHTGVARFQWTTFSEREPLRLPSLNVQRRIASVLSAYDELIENSQRRIRILEAMARALYREWFVHFRFPGHEKFPRVASPLGEIPKGWEVKPIQHFGHVITGKTPSKANTEFYGDDVPFVKTPDMHGNMFILNTSDRLSTAGAASQANKTLPAGSICVSCIGTIGVISMTTEECQTNQQINTVILECEATREFLFLRLQDAKQALENLGASGATMSNVNKGKFEAMIIVSPPTTLLAKYHRYAQPIFSTILTLSQEIQNLRRTRDVLLPRLISG
jgi:type I restriction enzyme S subunit